MQRSSPRVKWLAVACFAGVTGAWAARAQPDAGLRAEMQAVAQRRVFFGHQSVGMNLIEGLRELAARSGVPLRIADAQAPGVPGAAFTHVPVAENERPYQKLQSFAAAFDSGAAVGADLAMLKFCYVDFKADTDASALFAAYQAMIEKLRKRSPGTVFVHVTAPLTTVPGGFKATVKEMLGRPPPTQVLENARREEYNALVRKAYAGREPVFDLARIEATRPDGTAESVTWQGRAVPALVPSYSNDGGHLVGDGQLRAARELLSVLAAARPRASAGP